MSDPLIPPIVAAAERVLGAGVRLEPGDLLRDGGRNRVVRCNVIDDGGTDLPTTVIVKASVGEGESAYDPANDTVGSTAWRFFNEWAGSRFLHGIETTPPLCAGLIAGDTAAGIVVLEDLGRVSSLADAVRGDDPERATIALRRYADALGRTHAATVGRAAEFAELRRAIGGRETEREGEGVRWLRENVGPFRELCAALNVPIAPGFDDEIERIRHSMDEPPAELMAFSPCDTCPDNHHQNDVDGGVRFFDFEFAGFRHALLDAAYLNLPFPTCWCVSRFPAALLPELLAVYRARFPVPDAVFYPELVRASAYWTLSTVSWGWKGWMEKDDDWGPVSVRQRHVFRLENHIELAERHAVLPALTQTARGLLATLRDRWETLAPMPLYPAFRATEDE